MNDNQHKIIQEQIQANERIIRAVEHQQDGTSHNQVPVNERVIIKQMPANERVQQDKPTQPVDSSDDEK